MSRTFVVLVIVLCASHPPPAHAAPWSSQHLISLSAVKHKSYQYTGSPLTPTKRDRGVTFTDLPLALELFRQIDGPGQIVRVDPFSRKIEVTLSVHF